MVMQIRRTATANNPPPNLAEGQLAVEMASDPPKLWCGVPTAIDASGRIRITPLDPRVGDVRFDSGKLQQFDGTAWQDFHLPLPTVQRFTSGSGSYVPPANVSWIWVRMIGGGGGGGGAVGGGIGGTGGATSFGGWTANGGGAGAQPVNTLGALGGAGGTGGSAGAGTLVVRLQGGPGGQGIDNTQSAIAAIGGSGGQGVFGGAAQSGRPAVANTGSGGAGGYSSNAAVGSAGGGGAGEYVEMVISNPATSAYTVGAGGTSGVGTNPGSAGASGVIIVEENYG